MAFSEQSNLIVMQYTILGTMMRDPGCIGTVLAELEPEDFTQLGTRALFRALETLHNSGAPIEPMSIRQQLGEDYDAALQEAWNYSTDNISWYINALRDYSQAAAIHAAALMVASADDLEETMRRMDDLNALTVTQKRMRVFTASDMAEIMLTELDSKEPPVLYKTGFRQLDEVVQIEPGDVILIGGLPSSGKTALSLQMAVTMARKWRVGYYSLETDQIKAARRFLAAMASISLGDIKMRRFSDEQCRSAVEAAADFSSLNLDFIPSSSATVRDIQAMSLSRRHQIVFVDYLQIVIAGGKSRYEIVTNISQQLHRMAQDYHITVFALAQLTRPENEKGKPVPPSMSSFKESGQIEQDADVALLLYQSNPNDYRSSRILKVAKNKEGEKAHFELDFDGATQRFTVSKSGQFKNLKKQLSETAPPKKTAPQQLSMDPYPLDPDQTSDIPF